MATFFHNWHNHYSVECDANGVPTAAPVYHLAPANHQEAASKLRQAITINDILNSLKSQGVNLASIAVGDDIMIDFLPSLSTLVAVYVHIARPIPNFEFSIRRGSGGAALPATSTRIRTTIDSAGAAVGTTATAAPTGLGQFTGATIVDQQEVYLVGSAETLVSVPDTLFLRVTQLPTGGFEQVASACGITRNRAAIEFRTTIETYGYATGTVQVK